MKKMDMTGWKMWEHGVPDSKLEILSEAEPRITSGGNKKVCWRCRCLCGKEIVVPGTSLRNGNTKSCGCFKKTLLTQRNMQSSSVKIGNRYGKLLVIEDLGMRKQKSRNKNERWSLCQCDCGKRVEVSNNMLQNGWKKSCGCLHSHGEFVIEKILQENQIQYIKEYSFDDLRGLNNGKLRFDFAIFEDQRLSYLIEFDGRQHYDGPEATWTQGRSLEQIHQHDEFKNQYCLDKGITLKRIPYTALSSLTYEDIANDKYKI